MPKRNNLKKKSVRTASENEAVQLIVVRGSRRERLNPGLSATALAQIERYEASSARAEQRLGTIRLR